MTDYAETLREHARLAILRFCEDAPRYTSNVSMLAGMLPAVGIHYTRDQVAAQVAWLKDHGLVDTVTHANDFIVVTATVTGIEVATGIARHPGVQRPRPGQ